MYAMYINTTDTQGTLTMQENYTHIPEGQDPNEIKQILAEMKSGQMEKELDRIFDDLNTSGLPHGRMPEPLFVQVFLPYFAGKLDPEDFPKGITPATWFRIAGTRDNEVDVIDNFGKVLFTVPPIYTTKYIETRDYSSKIVDALNHVKEIEKSRPMEAKQLMKLELSRRLPIQQREIKQHFYKRWAEIFMRYGYFMDNENNVHHSEERSDRLEDLLEFDD